VISHPSVAGAAVLAGLIVAGGSYAARHDMGLGNGLESSATARASLARELPLGRQGRGQRHQLTWHPPDVPKIHVRSQAPRVIVSAAPVTTFAAPAPVAASSPVTRTSPVGGNDGSGDGGGDD
jgi:hypothetical protein